jgi:hypothetical protein
MGSCLFRCSQPSSVSGNSRATCGLAHALLISCVSPRRDARGCHSVRLPGLIAFGLSRRPMRLTRPRSTSGHEQLWPLFFGVHGK